MTSFQARNRLVNFRLTQEEMENLHSACAVRGARSLSEFARAAVLKSVGAEIGSEIAWQSYLDRLEARLAALDSLLVALVDRTDFSQAQNDVPLQQAATTNA